MNRVHLDPEENQYVNKSLLIVLYDCIVFKYIFVASVIL